MKNKKEKITQQEIYDKLEEMDNKLELIKSDTHNLNRLSTLNSHDVIVQELKKIIGRSNKRAAVLHLTKELIGAAELADRLGVSLENLSKYTNPFVGKTGYIAEIKKGRRKFFIRSEIVDLIAYESINEFSLMLKAWE